MTNNHHDGPAPPSLPAAHQPRVSATGSTLFSGVTSGMYADLKVRFPPRSVSRTVSVLLAAGAPCGKLNAFGRTARDIASAYTHQIMPEACVAASSGASLISESTLWDRLLHNVHSDWEAVTELLHRGEMERVAGAAATAAATGLSSSPLSLPSSSPHKTAAATAAAVDVTGIQ